jgi:2-phosphoglycerate kinase
MVGQLVAGSPPYTVLLLGGSSGTGKTTVAGGLSRHLGMPVAQVDDYRLFAQWITSPADVPDLHFFIDPRTSEQRAAMTPDELCERLIAVGIVTSRGLEPVVAHHLDAGQPMIIEGDGITPEFAARLRLERTVGARVGAVFLVESHEQTILARMAARGRGISAASPAERLRGARLSWLYGNWIGQEARDRGLAVVPSSPIETAYERLLAAL